jgi:hypothetical protein
MSMAAYGAPMYMVIIFPVRPDDYIYLFSATSYFYNCIYILYIIIISAGYLNLYGPAHVIREHAKLDPGEVIVQPP